MIVSFVSHFMLFRWVCDGQHLHSSPFSQFFSIYMNFFSSLIHVIINCIRVFHGALRQRKTRKFRSILKYFACEWISETIWLEQAYFCPKMCIYSRMHAIVYLFVKDDDVVETVVDPWKMVLDGWYIRLHERALVRTQTIYSALDILYPFLNAYTFWCFWPDYTERIVQKDRCGYDNFVWSLFLLSYTTLLVYIFAVTATDDYEILLRFILAYAQ